MKREETSGWLWGAYIPLVAIALLWPTHLWSLGLFGLYPLLSLKIYGQRQRSGELIAQARLYAIFCVISKFPQILGQLKYYLNTWQKRPAQLIEYK
jgi:hypothetical protein